MLLIEANDSGTRAVAMTVATRNSGKRQETVIKLWRPNPAGPFGGDLLGDIVLTKEQSDELKRNLY